MKTRHIITLVAGFMVFCGFGMIHANAFISRIGSILLGLGSLVLIIQLYRSISKKEEE